MTTDLTMLAWSATLCLALMLPQMLPQAVRRPALAGAGGLTGIRANLPAPGAMLGNLIPFAILVLAVAALDKASLLSALGAEIFFWSWLAHSALGLGGLGRAGIVPWTFSLVGTGLVISALIQS